MLGSVDSCSLDGIYATPVTVEVKISSGLPGYHVVGLPALAVREGTVRIRTALDSIGQKMPRRRITVNLAPADRKKDGAALDLPIALAVMVSDRILPDGCLDNTLVLGELALDGTIRPCNAALAAASLASEAGYKRLIVSYDSAIRGNSFGDTQILYAHHLGEIVSYLRDGTALPVKEQTEEPVSAGGTIDMYQIKGNLLAKRCLEIAATGMHNLMFVGPPGNGKTMMAQRLPTILPAPTPEESHEIALIYASLKDTTVSHTWRPYRAPHHSISRAALIGGGSPPRPGEVTLAHNGVLFLDELLEFPRSYLEGLRQPVEDRHIVINRIGGSLSLPASFLLVAAMNPCPCGWYGSNQRTCRCSFPAVKRYRQRLSGPLNDRFDLRIHVESQSWEQLQDTTKGESSEQVRKRVSIARQRQSARFAGSNCHYNAAMGPYEIENHLCISKPASKVLDTILKKRRDMTTRCIFRLLRVARTIADLASADTIDEDHIYESFALHGLADLIRP